MIANPQKAANVRQRFAFGLFHLSGQNLVLVVLLTIIIGVNVSMTESFA
jgi:hypothetical protein